MGMAVLQSGASDEGDGGMVGAAVSRLDAALDALAAVPFADLSLGEQAQAVAEVVRLRSRLEGIEAAALGAFDAGGEWALDGHRSAAAALSYRCRLSRPEARRRVRLARRLRSASCVAAALGRGEVTSEQAGVLVAARRPEVAAEFDRGEAVLVAQAETLSFAELVTVVRYWSDRVDPQGAETRAERREQQAHAHVSRTFDDLVRVDAWLDPVGGTAFKTAVDRIENELFRVDWAEAAAVHGADTTVAHLARTSSQRRAAALVELAVRATSAPADAKRPLPLVNVVIDAASFEAALQRRAGLRPAPVPAGTAVQCELLDRTVLTPRQAIELALAGHVRRVVYDTPDMISQMSPKRRFFTGTLRDLLEVRDRHCAHLGCDQPAWRCDGDHIEPHDPDPGNTTAQNGRLLCRYHHLLRQRLGHPPRPAPGDGGTARG